MSDVDMSATSSDEDSDYQGIEVSETDMNLIIQLEAKLEENPSNYDAFVQFIDVLRRCKMTERLREVRRDMHARFPLSESLWLDWITDELESIAGEDIPKIESLLEAAQDDYLSIALWIQRLEFVNNFDPLVQSGTPEGLQRMRDLAEEALNFHGAGLHCTEGSKLWDWYLNFELAQEAKEGTAPKKRDEAAERVRKLYRRRLAVPLHDGAETLAAYTAWEKERKNSTEVIAEEQDEGEECLVPKNVKRSFDFARRAYELRQPFEEALVTAAAAANNNNSASELLSAFMSYIKLEESGTADDNTTFSRVELMYERAVAAFPVTSFLWLQYGRYLEVVVQSTSAAESVYARGVRNCPWVGELYERILRLSERTGQAPEERQEDVYNKAMQAGLQTPEDYILIALARLDALRKHEATAAKDKKSLLERIKTVYSTVTSALETKFPSFYDPAFQLAEYSTSLEIQLSSSGKGETEALEAAKIRWEDALKAGQGAAAKCATGWLKYIGFLKNNLPSGSVVEAIREVFKRCYAREMEGYSQVEVCNAWLKFEREEGSAEDYFNAWSVAEPIISQATAAAAAAMQPAAEYGASEEAFKRPRMLSKEEKLALRQAKDPNFLKKKRKLDEEQQHDRRRTDGGAKRSRIETTTQPDASKPPSETATDGAKDTTNTEAQEAPSSTKDFAARRALTAFVKHLPENFSESSLRELFSPCGTINHIKVGIDHATGRQKGFAYIEFDTAEQLEAACKLHGTSAGEKTLFVAPSNPPADGSGGGGGRGGGGRGGLGGRGGRDGGRGRGGIGYSAGGFGGGGQVAKATQRGHLDISGGEGGGNIPTGDFKPVVGFVPRAAAIQKPFAQGGGGSGGEEQPKSNSDFRKMLLEKKS